MKRDVSYQRSETWNAWYIRHRDLHRDEAFFGLPMTTYPRSLDSLLYPQILNSRTKYSRLMEGLSRAESKLGNDRHMMAPSK